MTKKYKVAVFVHRGSKRFAYLAYLRDYSPEWKGCNIVEVSAATGAEAKRHAIRIVKLRHKLNPKWVKVG